MANRCHDGWIFVIGMYAHGEERKDLHERESERKRMTIYIDIYILISIYSVQSFHARRYIIWERWPILHSTAVLAQCYVDFDSTNPRALTFLFDTSAANFPSWCPSCGEWSPSRHHEPSRFGYPLAIETVMRKRKRCICRHRWCKKRMYAPWGAKGKS